LSACYTQQYTNSKHCLTTVLLTKFKVFCFLSLS